MKVEVLIPSPGESIVEVELASWLVDDKAWVEKDQEVAEVESEKATLPLLASHSGEISIKVQSGTIKVGSVACVIDTDAKKPKELDSPKKTEPDSKPEPKPQPVKEVNAISNSPQPAESPQAKVTPLARKLMDDNNLNVDDIIKGLRKITTQEVNVAINAESLTIQSSGTASRSEVRTPMSQLRKKLSQRLVTVKNQTAMLTTFNEVDMSRIMLMRKEYQVAFQEKHGVKLGFMSFFTKAVVEALKFYPVVNSQIEGDDIITPNYYDIGVAVQTPKGLMVPVLRNVETLNMAQIEKGILSLSEKGQAGRISLDELTGGTFTITNGGIFGSMLSTPILNPPQSGILGMHNIIERPIAVNGKVEIRPMMYIALSYDHRVIDGKDSVGFLVKVKQMLERPELLITSGVSIDEVLLSL